MIRTVLSVGVAAFAFTVLCGDHATADSGAMDWSGVYIGAHGGLVDVDVDFTRGSSTQVGTPGSTVEADGAAFGGLVGLNMQDGNIVYGIEGDFTLGDIDGTNSTFTLPDADIEAIGTIRARVGVAYDRFLFFGTAGVGIAGVESTERGNLDDSNVHVGVVVGAGVEYALTASLIGRVEGQYGAYDERRYVYGTTPNPHSHGAEFETAVFRASLIWKFGMPALPGN